MAEVFLAEEVGGAHSLERPVVIKRILPHLAGDAAFVEMFHREARVAAGINHPNVVKIYELGDWGDLPFMAMEFVAGCSFRRLLAVCRERGEPVPLGVAVHLMVQACAGAHAAHELRDADGALLGLVHRDISPQNLMVDPDGHVKLLDFGIAKARGSEATRTGVVKGKLAYMPPEQIMQRTLDRRSDVFALGLVAYELLSLHKAHEARHDLQLVHAVVHGLSKPLRVHRPDLPEPVVEAVQRAIERDPDARFPTARALERALLEAARSAGVEPDAEGSRALVRRASAADGSSACSGADAGDADERVRGTVFGAYELERVVAPTRWGAVFLARERPGTSGARSVALTLRDGAQLPPGIREDLFACWAQAARTSHPALVAVTDFGAEHGCVYSATLWLDGWDLEALGARLSGSDLSLTTVQLASLGAEMADALAVIHDTRSAAGEPLGLVHGGLAPAGVVITTSGHMRILGPPASSAAVRGIESADVQAVASLAPEQLLGRSPGASADTYSVAIVLATLASGSHPLLRDSVEATREAVLAGEVGAILGGVDPELAAVLEGALSRDPAARPTMAGLASSLLGLARALGGPRQPADWRVWVEDLGDPASGHRGSSASATALAILDAVEQRSERPEQAAQEATRASVPTQVRSRSPRRAPLALFAAAALVLALTLVGSVALRGHLSPAAAPVADGALQAAPAEAARYLDQAVVLLQEGRHGAARGVLELARSASAGDATTNIRIVQLTSDIERAGLLAEARRHLADDNPTAARRSLAKVLDARPADEEALALLRALDEATPSRPPPPVVARRPAPPAAPTRPEPPPAVAKTGTLHVTSEPPGVVYINGVPVATAPWTEDLPPGAHSIEVRLGGHEHARRQVEVVAGRQQTVELELMPVR